MKPNYFDPMFYIPSDKMQFTIRIKCNLKETVDAEILDKALQKSIKRYPYFLIRVKQQDECYISVPNDLPVVLKMGPDVPTLGSAEVNWHMLALTCYQNTITFCISHIITDGAGFCPFIKTVLYYYLCMKYNIKLDSRGINLCDDELFDDEVINPYPEGKMKNSNAFFEPKRGEYFNLKDGGIANDDEATVYYIKVNQNDFMKYNRKNDGTPCSFGAVLAAKAIWNVHPDMNKNLVCDVSFNLRPAMGNLHNYRMLCSSFPLIYPPKLKDRSADILCTLSRGMILLNSQEENVINYCENLRSWIEKIENLPTLELKKKTVSEEALRRATDNTYSISYVGNVDLGEIGQYIDSIYNLTDGSVYGCFFIEISSVNDYFDISFIQGFSSDVYYREFVKLIEENNIRYIEEGNEKFCVPKVVYE